MAAACLPPLDQFKDERLGTLSLFPPVDAPDVGGGVTRDSGADRF